MAPEVGAIQVSSPYTGPSQWGEREVRRLLRALRRPHVLAMEPLARFIGEIYKLENPYDACLRFIDDTFVNGGLVGKRLFELIRTCDIEANETLEATASDMGVSARQFFRYRREAILALVAHANRLGAAAPRNPMEELARLLGETDPAAASEIYGLAGSPERITIERIEVLLNAGEFFGSDVVERFTGTERLRVLAKVARACFTFGNLRAGETLMEAVRAGMMDSIVEDREALDFEMAYAEYVRVLHAGDVTRCAELALAARQAALGDEMRTIAAILVQAESAVRAGDLTLAEQTATAVEAMVLQRRQLRLVTVTICLRAAIAFMRNDVALAYGYIHSAQLALHDRPLDAMTIHASFGRVALAGGLPWRAPRHLLEVSGPPIRTLAVMPGSALVALDGSTRRAYPRLYLQIVDLRAALALGQLNCADEIIETLALTRQGGYRSLEASALSVLATWYSRNAQFDEAQNAVVKAWTVVTEIGDYYAAHDLFADLSMNRDFGVVDLDDAFLAAFSSSLHRRFPGAAVAREPASVESRRFWRTLLLAAGHGVAPDAAPVEDFLRFLQGRPQTPENVRHRGALVRYAPRDAAMLLAADARAAFCENLTLLLETRTQL